MSDHSTKTEYAAKSCQRGCKAIVPKELETESICASHFILAVESACADMRREAATGLATPARRGEIESYVKNTALKLSEVATSSTRLTDEVKKRVLTTLLTLMNLQESVDRSVSRLNRVPIPRPPQRVFEPVRMVGALRG
jgi:hypothetical protein